MACGGENALERVSSINDPVAFVNMMSNSCSTNSGGVIIDGKKLKIVGPGSFFKYTPVTSSCGSQDHFVAVLAGWSLPVYAHPAHCTTQYGIRGILNEWIVENEPHHVNGFNVDDNEDANDDNDDDDGNEDDDNDGGGGGGGGGVELWVTPVDESHFPVADYPGFGVWQEAILQQVPIVLPHGMIIVTVFNILEIPTCTAPTLCALCHHNSDHSPLTVPRPFRVTCTHAEGNHSMAMEGPLSIFSDEVSDTDEGDAAFEEGDKIDEGKDNHSNLTRPVVRPSPPPVTFSSIFGTHKDNNYAASLKDLSAGAGATNLALGLVMSDQVHIGSPDYSGMIHEDHQSHHDNMILPFYSQFGPPY